MARAITALARIAASNFGRLPVPAKLTYAVTYACNLRCTVCSIWKRPKTPELSFEEIERFFSRSNAFSWVSLTGGEIVLRPDIVPIAGTVIRRCRDLCVLSFPTNGYDTERIAAAVEKIRSFDPPRLYVTVSVDGPPSLHDEIRGTPGSWARAVATYAALKKIRGVQTLLSMTLSRRNVGTIEETLRSLRDAVPSFNARQDMNFNIFHRSDHYYRNGDVPGPDTGLLKSDLAHALRLLRGVSAKGILQYAYYAFGLRYLDNPRLALPCQALSVSCFMDPSGEIYPCAAFDRRLGNVRDYGYSLKEMWRAEKTVRTHRECRGRDCPGCWSPCEAYPSIYGSLVRSLGEIVMRQRYRPTERIQ